MKGAGMVGQKQPQSRRYRDTAFRIFILMRPRRHSSDALLRHDPELRPAMRAVTNAFQPWVAGTS